MVERLTFICFFFTREGSDCSIRFNFHILCRLYCMHTSHSSVNFDLNFPPYIFRCFFFTLSYVFIPSLLPLFVHSSPSSPFFPLSTASSPPIALRGPLFTIMLMTSNKVSAAAMVVSSALVSYAGATSTMSAATKFIPSRPRRMVRSSRVDQPPVSGVPVAGASCPVFTC